jgi:hypothetical protein
MKKYANGHYGNQGDVILESKIEDNTITSVYTKTIKKIEDLEKAIIDGVEHINLSNEILTNNKNNLMELKDIEENTPAEEKNDDYYDYINDLKTKIIQK